MKNKRLGSKTHGFFSMMLLISSILIITFSICASFIIYSLSSRYEKAQFLKNYELAMINLSEIIENKYLDFKILSGKLLTNNQINPYISAFLEADSYDNVTPIIRNECLDLLNSLCNDDRYLRGFLLYSNQSNNLYYYSNAKSSFSYAKISPDELGLIPFTVTTVDLNLANAFINQCTNNREDTYSLYGFSATIFNKPTSPLGYLIPLYHTSEFFNSLEHFNLDNNCYFTIEDKDNKLFFKSNLYASAVVSTGYHNSYVNKYSNKISYFVSPPKFHLNSITYQIGLVSFIVAFLSFVLYYVTYYFSRKNIKHILTGMQAFRLTDLTYRIQSSNTNNEFTQIIDGFNAMCDELQRNVELTYLYEIQQKKSELYALQTSINPHFLYNTLEMIRNQIIQEDYNNSSKMLLLLSKVHRNQTNTKIFVTIAYDLEICESLMELYQSRFQNFDYEFNLDEDASQYGIPKNTIQPLIENYFVHGLVSERIDNLIEINVSLQIKNNKKYIHFSIFNNGYTISKETIHFINERLEESIYENTSGEQGFALANVYKRLKIVFQSDCEMTVSTFTRDSGFKMDIRFPACSIKELEDYLT